MIKPRSTVPGPYHQSLVAITIITIIAAVTKVKGGKDFVSLVTIYSVPSPVPTLV